MWLLRNRSLIRERKKNSKSLRNYERISFVRRFKLKHIIIVAELGRITITVSAVLAFCAR